MKIDWAKWRTRGVMLVFLVILLRQPVVIQNSVGVVWDGFSTAFGPYITEGFDWLGKELSSAVS